MPATEWDGFVVDTFGGLGSHTTSCTGDCSEIFISEYMEGSGTQKALEFYNPTASTVNLGSGSYKVELYQNGSPTPLYTISLTGSVAAKCVYVLRHSGASLVTAFDQEFANLDFNGDDTIVLKKGTTVIDSIGRLGEVPAGGWGTDPINTENNTLRRLSTVKKGDANPTDAYTPESEWSGYAQDTVDGFGTHTSSCGGSCGSGGCPGSTILSQNWTDTGLITVDDNWSSLWDTPSTGLGIRGYMGSELTGTDPQLIVAEGFGTLDVNANQTDPNGFSTGGVTEFHLTNPTNPTVALAGSNGAIAPFLLLSFSTTGKTNICVSYNLRDIDGSTDNSVQPVALHYRVGASGTFTNVPAGFVADASGGPSTATKVTAVQATLPAAADNQAIVQVRVMTANASGNDEWIGVDDILVKGQP